MEHEFRQDLFHYYLHEYCKTFLFEGYSFLALLAIKAQTSETYIRKILIFITFPYAQHIRG